MGDNKLLDKLHDLNYDIICKLQELIESHGVDNDVCGAKVLKIEDDELMYNIKGSSSYTVAISDTYLISKDGYTYTHDHIELDELCEIIDSFDI